ncbi:MAG TPA: serine/threonine-protein kinase, partial [Myxococcota bacterium]
MRVCDVCGLCFDDEFDVCAFDGAALSASLAGPRILAGRYRLEKQLAEGAMGQVFEAVHLAVGSRVAVKVMQPQQKDVRVAVQRFHKEARILGAVKHPNAVLITDFDVDTRSTGAVPFLVTELLRGRPLSALLDDKRVLDLDEVERIVGPLAEAVDEAHALGIIHRDLKPSNVFLERLRDG